MLTIRPTTRDDVPQLLGLIRELATYKKKRHKWLSQQKTCCVTHLVRNQHFAC